MKAVNYIAGFLGLAAVTVAAVYVSNTTDTPPAIVYQKQIVITKGGHYTGNYKGTKDSAAIWIWASDTVWLDNVNLLIDGGGGVKMSGGTKVIINNLKGHGITPVSNYQYGRFIEDYQPNYFYLKNFEADSTAGILFDHSKTGVQPLIQVYNGTIKNTLGLYGNGSEGKPRAGMQFNTVLNMNPASEAKWIEFRNEWKKSRVEDNFNFYNSSNFKLSNFCIYGAYNLNPSVKPSTSGITMDGSMQEGNNKLYATHNFEASDGYIISTMNAAINIAAGYNNYLHDIVCISSGMTPDGVKSNSFWSGTCIFNGNHYPDSIFYGNRISGNTIGFVNNGNENYPYKGRQDENKDRNVNKMPVGGNTFFPDRQITLTLEDSVYGVWKAKVAAAGVVLGISNGSQPQAPQPPATTVPVDTPKPPVVPVQPVKHDTVTFPAVHDTTIIYKILTPKFSSYDTTTIIIK